MATRGGKREGAGRPKGFAALEAEKARAFIAEKLSTEFAPIVTKAISQAQQGDKHAREWLTDRAYGKAVQAIDLRGKDGEPLFDDETRAKAKAALGQLIGGNLGEGGQGGN